MYTMQQTLLGNVQALELSVPVSLVTCTLWLASEATGEVA
jgi:hypothetical protein